LLSQSFPRNIRQFRDTVNAAIDQAAPLISECQPYDTVRICVGAEHLKLTDDNELDSAPRPEPRHMTGLPHDRIAMLRLLGMGPRRISNQLARDGYEIPYHRIAYYLNKMGL